MDYMPQAPKLVRWIRRFTLTARNHYMRDNIVVEKRRGGSNDVPCRAGLAAGAEE